MDSTHGASDGLAGDWPDLESSRGPCTSKDFENKYRSMLHPRETYQRVLTVGGPIHTQPIAPHLARGCGQPFAAVPQREPQIHPARVRSPPSPQHHSSQPACLPARPQQQASARSAHGGVGSVDLHVACSSPSLAHPAAFSPVSVLADHEPPIARVAMMSSAPMTACFRFTKPSAIPIHSPLPLHRARWSSLSCPWRLEIQSKHTFGQTPIIILHRRQQQKQLRVASPKHPRFSWTLADVWRFSISSLQSHYSLPHSFDKASGQGCRSAEVSVGGMGSQCPDDDQSWPKADFYLTDRKLAQDPRTRGDTHTTVSRTNCFTTRIVQQ
jgi:hypothetical protein